MKDTLEIPLELGLRKRAGVDGWFFGRTLNAFYINFVQPWTFVDQSDNTLQFFIEFCDLEIKSNVILLFNVG